MMVWPPFKSKDKAAANDAAQPSTTVLVSWDREGARFRPEPAFNDWLSSPASFAVGSELVLLLRQLEEEGFAELRSDGVSLSWSDYYTLMESPEHGDALGLFGLPKQEPWKPVLSSSGTLSDSNFVVSIQGWLDPYGQRPNGNVGIDGAVLTAGGKSAIMPEAAWRMVQAIVEQRSRKAGERTPDANKRDWSTIRGHASRAGADLSDYLRKTVVLTPERLRIDLRRGDVIGDKLVEVMPGFDGAPPRWLEMFDRFDTVPERYEIPDGNGLVHVLLSEEARTVLREIRRMPGRRIAGERAEAFVRNPFATLGPDAAKVIDPEQFERAREDAGIVFARFTAKVSRDDTGRLYEVALIIEETLQGAVQAEQFKFEGPVALERFLNKLEAKMVAGAQCCHWEGFDLEILGDTPSQAGLLRVALNDWQRPGRISAADIFDLSRYSERVGGFGVEKPYYSPFIAKKSEDAGWFPENVDLGLCFTPEDGGETVAIALDRKNLDTFRGELDKAREEGREIFDFPGCLKPVPVAWAVEALETLGQVREDVSKGSFDPKKFATRGRVSERRGLVVKPNVDALDYEERRGVLAASIKPVVLPSAMFNWVKLKEHQLHGVAWLQHLWRHSPTACRGALLADDMGLGKTIQLLTFMAAAIEREPSIDPFLVVAPVSLLENWKEEIAKFFAPGAMKVLTLYGPDLASKRVSKAALDEGLIEAGSPKLLSPGWLGSAQVVLTTYETLRDLEFSLAAQRWSAMICDEAQKIKNPNALVTRAAKKQNARLKIACTGTPVENTLTDIWCLFDFVQPGLLGALKDFGSKYRKPIESETDEEMARIEELRGLIEPQKLRRTKAEVAKDLPKKIEFEGCRALPLSQRQRALYGDAIAQFRSRSGGCQATGMQSPLGLLQYLRRLCSDPRSPGHLSTESEPLADIERNSPKMAWMLGHLQEIKQAGEKAIVFCEFRDLQRTLQRAILDRFAFTPDVINGDVSANSVNANSRQKRIRAFQEMPGFGVIVLSPLAVGFGVNIQAANHVIHFTRTWNPAKEDQATDRAYRIGQERDVYVYYPVVVAHDFLTFDAKLDKLLDKKRALSTDMLNGAGDVSAADFGDLEAPDGGNAFSNEPMTADDIGSLDGDTFEAFCALLWNKMGYSRTIKTKRVGDGGIDVVAIKRNEGALIQCKSSTVDNKELGWEGVKDVSAGSAAYAARYPGITFSMLAVTNRRFNQTARSQAGLLKVELIEGDQLAEMLALYPMKRGELERFLLASWGAV
ncbi:SNF2-related protein [Ralstonia pseudosolanacearum]|uniref:SNF2-related protein n=1 Tax=Ralstonia pseudosolanacearum TaxID=1310165 RepID=UPI003369C809